MNKICKQYIKDVRSFFPVIGKQEKEYLKKIAEHVEDYCENENITSVEELYTGFGAPTEVLSTYYSTVDTKHILTQVKKAHYVKILFVVLICAILIVVSTYCSIRLAAYYDWKSQLIFSEETIIE